MTQVIKHGTKTHVIATCGVCGCEFAYKKGEVKMETFPIYNVPLQFTKQYGGEHGPCGVEHQYYVECPDCLSKVLVNREEVN